MSQSTASAVEITPKTLVRWPLYTVLAALLAILLWGAQVAANAYGLLDAERRTTDRKVNEAVEKVRRELQESYVRKDEVATIKARVESTDRKVSEIYDDVRWLVRRQGGK